MTNRKAQRGFSLLEAVIAMFIFLIAMIGLAAVYVQSAVVSEGSFYRSIASAQVMDMADRMRANAFLDDSESTAGAYEMNACPTSAPTTADCTGGCDPDEMIAVDKWQWCERNRGLFGSQFDSASIEFDSGRDAYDIAISWNEKKPESGDAIGGHDWGAVEFKYSVRRP